MDNKIKEDLMRLILDEENLSSAARKVKSNGGAPGIDNVTVDEMWLYLEEHRQEVVGKILNLSYKPKPVRRVEIPKPDGGVRLLGIPACIDRTIQQAVAQVLTPIFEAKFSDSSYGFRPGRSAQDAMTKAYGYYKEGYRHAVDIDLQKYFDTVNHDKLLQMLRDEIEDNRVIGLIRKFLKSGVLVGGFVSHSDEGVPQGGPLSPLLSNIYLTKLDKMLEGRGLHFVRYADDCNIYVKSRRAAERVMQTVTSFLEKTLRLKVNQDKSKVGSPLKLKFLGFSMWNINGKSGIRVHEKSVKRFKEKVVKITKRNRGRSFKTIVEELRTYTRGWLGYFGLASLSSKAKQWDGWIRRRLRCYLWKQWKKIKTRKRNLIALGADKDQAWQWANTRKMYWHTAKSWILTTTLTNKKLKAMGYADLETMLKNIQERRTTS
jgi:group II intron reverse transcriptase/maturase